MALCLKYTKCPINDIDIAVFNLYNLLGYNLIYLRRFACCQGAEESALIFNVIH